MRAFYEAWNGIETKSSVTTDDLKQISPVGELKDAQVTKSRKKIQFVNCN